MEEALVFGGETLTLTDVAVAAGRADIGDRDLVCNLSAATVRDVMGWVERHLSEAVDRMKTSAVGEPLLVVGGGAILTPETIAGISEILLVPNHGVANAVGAAMAQVSGEVDHVFRDMERDELLRRAEEMARARAVAAGADAETLKVVDVEDLPLAYLPGNAVRARVRVVGDIANVAEGGDDGDPTP
jgi:hypothetical protein